VIRRRRKDLREGLTENAVLGGKGGRRAGGFARRVQGKRELTELGKG